MRLALLLTLALLSLLLLTHDLVPLGRWNNLRASAPARPLPHRLAFTFLNSLTGLIPIWLAVHTIGPNDDRRTILIVLAILLLGELTSWWLPWLFGTSILGGPLSPEPPAPRRHDCWHLRPRSRAPRHTAQRPAHRPPPPHPHRLSRNSSHPPLGTLPITGE